MSVYTDFDDALESVDFELELMHHQGDWILCPAQELFVGGAAGPGKSHFLRAVAIHYALLIPGLQIILFRRQFPDLTKNHMQGPNSFYAMLAPLIHEKVVRITGSAPYEIKFKNGLYGDFETGSKITLSHLQHEKNLNSHQGPEYHLVLFDELTHFAENMYRFLRSRLRMPGIEFPDEVQHLKDEFPKIISASNPGGEGHTWVKQTFIEDAEPFEIRKMGDDEGGMTRCFMPARMESNEYLDTANYRAQLRGLGNPVLVKAMEEGDWDIAPGAVFSEVWDPAVHWIDPFIIPSSWYIDRSFDWGWSRPFSVGWWAQSDGTPARCKKTGKELHFARGSLFRIAEWYGWRHPNWPPEQKPRANVGIKLDALSIAEGIKARERRMGLRYCAPGVADTQIFENSNNHCIADEMEGAGISWERANKNPGSRKAGLQLAMRMLINAKQKYRELPGLYVWKSCKNFKRTIPVLPSSEGEPDDIDTNTEDHIWDETRYRVLDTGFSIGEITIGGI